MARVKKQPIADTQAENLKTDDGYIKTIKFYLKDDEVAKECQVTCIKTPKGYYYNTGFWHAWIEGGGYLWSLFIQEKIKSADYKTSTLIKRDSKDNLEKKMAQIFLKWS